MSAFRKMRRKNQQLDQSVCEAILEQAPRGVLSVLGDDGYPYGVPMNFVYDDGKIYFHSAREGHKVDAITCNDKASFCVRDDGRQNEGEWWWHFNSVIAFGRIHIVSDENLRIEALRKLGGKYFPSDLDTEADIARNGARVHVLELTIEHLTGKRVQEK